MINNLELVLSASRYDVDEPSLTSDQKQIIKDILPDITDEKLKEVKSPVHIRNRKRKAA